MLESKPPFAFSSGGKVYRKDDDSTHLPMFNQVEAIYVDDDVNFGNLKYLINQLLLKIFGESVEIKISSIIFPIY